MSDAVEKTNVSTNSIKVLLIEDNPGDARLVREMLSVADEEVYDVKWASRFETGLKILEREALDIIISDLYLPDSRGYDTLKQLLARTDNLPIIVMTGYDDEVEAVKAVKEGAQDYLVKGKVNTASLTCSIKLALESIKGINELKAMRKNQINNVGDQGSIAMAKSDTDEQLRSIKRPLNMIKSLLSTYHQFLQVVRSGAVSDAMIAQVEALESAINKDALFKEIIEKMQYNDQQKNSSNQFLAAVLKFYHPNGYKQQEVDLNTTIEKVVSKFRKSYSDRIRIEPSYENSMPSIFCYPDEFDQALLNLLLISHTNNNANLSNDSSFGENIILNVSQKNESAEIIINKKILNGKDDYYDTNVKNTVSNGVQESRFAICKFVIEEQHKGKLQFEERKNGEVNIIVNVPLAGNND